jgi:hypothetical protein
MFLTTDGNLDHGTTRGQTRRIHHVARVAQGWQCFDLNAYPSRPVARPHYLPPTEIAMRLFQLLLFGSALLCHASAIAGNPPAKAAFEQLTALAGRWQSADSTNATSVEIRTIANGSTLVETWTMSPTRQSMTVYTMDGDRLLATHYCPQGNAPRLEFARTDESGAHHFEFLDGANLQDPKGSHEHAFWIRKDAGGTITRNETYIANAAVYDPSKDLGSTERFQRAR